MSTDASRPEIHPGESVYTHPCGNPECRREAKHGRRWGRYCSAACRSAVYNSKYRPRSLACGPKRRIDIAQEFALWLATGDGLTVYSEAKEWALRLKGAGYRHYSMDAIIQRIRFDRSVKVGPDADGYKISDHHTSRLARLLMERVPELGGFFTLRRLRG